MIEWLANLWNKNKILFFILLPLCLMAVGVKMYLAYLSYQAEQSLEEAENKDVEIKKQQAVINKKIDKKLDEIGDIEEKIENRSEDDIDEDWHLK